MMLKSLFLGLAACAAAFSFQAAATATVYNLSPTDDWFSVIGCDGCAAGDLLQPGDEVILQPGTYSDPRRINLFHRGTAANPITIRAADPNNRPLFTRPFDASQSTNHVLNLEGAQYVTLNGLEVTGGAWGIRIGSTLRNPTPGFVPNGLPDAGPLTPAMAGHITLENNYVHHTGANAITANIDGDDYDGIIIRNNEISNTGIFGEGLYLGCNNNNCQFHDGLIEGNYIHDLKGPLVDQGDGIEIKHGSYANVVRNNVIHDTRFPGLLAYGTAGNGDPNIFEGNVVWGSENQTVQIAADAIVRNNLIFASNFESFRSQNHQGATPGNLTIVNNTIIANNADAIRIASSVTAPIIIANNAIYARVAEAIQLPSLGGVTVLNNVGSGNVFPGLASSQFDATGDILLDFLGLDWNGPGLDAFPTALSKLLGKGDAAIQPTDDFNNTSRSGTTDVGAYVYDAAGNPGWQVTTGFKQFAAPGIAGDYNNDGTVDAADYTVWLDNFGASAGTLPNDGDGGAIGQAQYDTWKANFGTGSAAVASASSPIVPEPCSALLAVCGVLVLLGARRIR